MGIRFDKRYDGPPLARCAAIGLHPLYEPLGEDHHTDRPFTAQDREVGDALAHFLGTLFADVDGEGSRYWYHERTSVDEWSRVARALRIHGLKIADAKVAASATTDWTDPWPEDLQAEGVKTGS